MIPSWDRVGGISYIKYPSYLMLTDIVITITRNNHSYGVQVTMFEGQVPCFGQVD